MKGPHATLVQCPGQFGQGAQQQPGGFGEGIALLLDGQSECGETGVVIEAGRIAKRHVIGRLDLQCRIGWRALLKRRLVDVIATVAVIGMQR